MVSDVAQAHLIDLAIASEFYSIVTVGTAQWNAASGPQIKPNWFAII